MSCQEGGMFFLKQNFMVECLLFKEAGARAGVGAGARASEK